MAGRIWVVTGASRGFGLATARRAVAAGDAVALFARGPQVLAAAAELGEAALGVQVDVTDAASISAGIAATVQRFGRIDVLVNNAGLHRGGPVDRISFEDWAAVLDTNLSGPFRMVRAALPHLPAGGAIINVGAVVGERGFPGDAPYGASKSGLAGLTRVLAVELARRAIRVNLVVPGFVLTEMTSAVSERARERIVAKIPLRRMGTAEEIAQVIHWVASSGYMTGAVVPVDGGLSCAL
ncbi:MAG: beta-ketoacyl-ACP reductase [Porticoccaceae bacterium]|nr:MAG: beta-ketoacyl-ACP reductase [Porticoccaceae bacterium]